MDRRTKKEPLEKRETNSRGKDVSEEQPRPRLPLFSGGDPTLAERFEEELYKRKGD